MILTDIREKHAIVKAASLGVRDYVLRSCFAQEKVLARIAQLVEKEKPAVTHPQPAENAAPRMMTEPSAAPANPAPRETDRPGAAAVPAPDATPDVAHWPRLLSREKTLERMDQVTGGKTIAGVVAQVVAVASSPGTDLGDVVRALQGDPILASRVLQLANSAATGGRKRISTLDDAARSIGVRGIQNMAISVGIFGAFPPDERDGFNSIRSWQHSFAVGELMALIMRQRDPVKESLHHLAGLCHDLGDILLRQHFMAEYDQVLQFSLANGLDVRRVEAVALGVRHPELVARLLLRIGLPTEVVSVIREFYERSGREQAGGISASAQILGLANSVAHGLLLAASDQETIQPISRIDWRTLGSDKPPPLLDPTSKRDEILLATNIMARLPLHEERRLLTPLVARVSRRVAYVRPESFLALDPLAYALEFMAETTVFTELPPPESLCEFDAMVVVGLRAGIAPAAVGELARRYPADLPILVLTGNNTPLSHQGPITARSFPIRLCDLHAWLTALTPRGATHEGELQQASLP